MNAWIAWIVGAYVIGSIPFGVLIGRTKGIDIRQHGSRNIGATNVSRVLGKKLGALCFALDFIKGAGPVICSGLAMGTFGNQAAALTQTAMWCWLAVGLATIVGHIFPLFLGLRGGKGVATALGAMTSMYPLLTLPSLAAMVVWYVVLRISKYVSIASIAAVSALPIGYLLSIVPPDALEQPLAHTTDRLWHASPPLVGTLALAALVIFRHRGNLARIRRGEEPKAGQA
jgi:acyl phosphate:glycerol-3-phosphate acyltransferase